MSVDGFEAIRLQAQRLGSQGDAAGAVKTWKRFAQSLEAAGDELGAIDAWKQVLEISETDSKAHGRLAELLYRQDRVEEALAHRGASLAARSERDKPVGKRYVPPPADPTAQEVYDQLQRLADGDGPIVAGPWQGEVGYEILYWIPFLRSAVRRFGIDPARIQAASRGGAGCWYEGISDTAAYADIFDHITPEEVASLADERRRAVGSDKADRLTPWDQKLLERLGAPAGASLLHPELMFRLFTPYWKGAAPFALVGGNTEYERMAAPSHPIVDQLPESFTAVKFYSRSSFPMNEANAAFVERFTLDLAEAGPVVFMDTQVTAHDHEDFRAPDHPNVMSIRSWLSTSDNLTAQSAVVARSSQVVCTYGGFAYLPLCYERPVMSFYSDDGHQLATHSQVAFHLSRQMNTPLGVLEARPIAAVCQAAAERFERLRSPAGSQ